MLFHARLVVHQSEPILLRLVQLNASAHLDLYGLTISAVFAKIRMPYF